MATDELAEALTELVGLADAYPGAFKPEFELGYWAGVASGESSWYVRFEGDIADNEFTVLGTSAAEALRAATAEAKRLAS